MTHSGVQIAAGENVAIIVHAANVSLGASAQNAGPLARLHVRLPDGLALALGWSHSRKPREIDVVTNEAALRVLPDAKLCRLLVIDAWPLLLRCKGIANALGK
jgi:hypothetical protein